MKLFSETLPLKLLTPCWLTGANQAAAEWRVASMRGQLRWWLRALSPGSRHDISLLGGDGGAGMTSSCIRLDTSPPGNATAYKHDLDSYRNTRPGEDETYLMWPIDERPRGVWMPCPGDAGFDLKWSCVRPFAQITEWNRALAAFSILGSIGGRSSRGYGSIWPRKDAPSNLEELTATLNALALPAHIRVRLLDGVYDHPRKALAAAALWLKTLRSGSSRSGVPASTEGQQDHDLGLQVIAGSAPHHAPVHRPVLGLPLQQTYTGGRGKVVTKHNGSDRHPSPVRLKIVRFGNDYRILVIVMDHDDYRWPAGTSVKLNRHDTIITHDILNIILTSGAVVIH